MISLTIQCNVTEDRCVHVQLPPRIRPGRHEIVLVLDEHTFPLPDNQAEQLMQFAGAWRSDGIDPLTYQQQAREEWE